MVNKLKTAGLIALITALATSPIYAKQDTPKINSYNNDPVKPYYSTKKEDISDKIEVKDSFEIGPLLCERVTGLLDYFNVRGKEGLYKDITFEFLYKGITFESDEMPAYPSAVNNLVKKDEINELVGSFSYNKEDIAIWILSLTELEPNKYFALFKTKNPVPKKELKIEIIKTEKN